MGLVLDSSVLIAAERESTLVSDLLINIERAFGETEVVISSVTVVELEHGLHRARSEQQVTRRRDYLDNLFAAVPVESFTKEMAQIAAKIDAESRRLGITVPFPDLMIGVTALYFGYSLGTRNLRHFKLISGLKVIEL